MDPHQTVAEGGYRTHRGGGHVNTEQRFEDAGLKAWSDPATSQGMPRPPEAERVGGQMRCSAQPPEGAGAQAADTLTAAHWGHPPFRAVGE